MSAGRARPRRGLDGARRASLVAVWLVSGAFALVVGWRGTTEAVAAGGTVAQRPVVIDVEPPSQRVAVVQGLAPVLARLGLVVVAAGGAQGAPRPAARVAIALGERPTVTVVDGATGAIVVRRELSWGASVDVRREEAVIVASSALEGAFGAVDAPVASVVVASSSSAAPSASTPVASPTTKPPTSPSTAAPHASLPTAASPSAPATVSSSSTPPAARPPTRVELTAFGAVGAYARSFDPVVGLAGALDVALGGPRGPAVKVVVGHVAPIEGKAEGVEVAASVSTLRVVPVATLSPGSTLRFDLGVGAGGAIERLTVGRAPPTALLVEGAVRVAPLAVGLASARFEVGRGVALSVAAVADVALVRRRYVVDRGDEREAALAPARVQPWALFGVSFSPWGSP